MIGFQKIREGDRVMVEQRNGAVRFVDGPQMLVLLGEQVQPLGRYAAGPDEYLDIEYKDGTREHVPGPANVWWNPVTHRTIQVQAATKVDANEALVVYTRETKQVQRRVVYGPALFVPTAEEWVHEFRWHGADPKQNWKKVPRALRFTKLRVIPDQMYFDVDNVRTADDALLVVQLMVFFELVDIERMLDQTHDPVADFINALTADVIDWVGARHFERFKADTEQLNQIENYPQLVGRAERIGYRITKVVYRGYFANEKLQVMHDNAIECRTRLKLEAETQRQEQELVDMKLEREKDRAEQQQELEETQTRHQTRMQDLVTQAETERQAAKEKQALEAQRQQGELEIAQQEQKNRLELDHERQKHEAQAAFFQQIKAMDVDLTRYLVAQYQNPDKLIRITNDEAQLHLHEN